MHTSIDDIHPHDVDNTYGYGSATSRVTVPFDIAANGMATLYVSQSSLYKTWKDADDAYSLRGDSNDWLHFDMKINPSDIAKVQGRDDVMDCENMGTNYFTPELLDVRVKMKLGDIATHVEDGRFAFEQKQETEQAQVQAARSQERAEFRERVMTDLVDANDYEVANVFQMQ